MNTITEKTLIPIGLAAAIIGGVYWFTASWVEARAEAKLHAGLITSVIESQRLYNADLKDVKDGITEVRERVIRIEEKVSK